MIFRLHQNSLKNTADQDTGSPRDGTMSGQQTFDKSFFGIAVDDSDAKQSNQAEVEER